MSTTPTGQLNVRDPGGPFSEAFGSAYYRPFERETGIRINQVHGGQEPAEKIREMVANGDYSWDVASVSHATSLSLSDDPSALAPLEIGRALDQVPPGYRNAFFAGDHVYANVLAYRQDSFSASSAPRSWADFWEISRFVGRRSLRHFPMDTLEQALLADGVDADSLYPLDVARAFASLDRIKPHIGIWWTQGSEMIPLFTNNRTDMCALTSLRAIRARELGAPVGIAWHQNIRTVSGWSILRDTPRLAAAREFVRFALDPKRQALMATMVAVSPSIPEARQYIPAERRADLPDAHRDGAIEYDASYWRTRKLPLIAAFDAWRPSA